MKSHFPSEQFNNYSRNVTNGSASVYEDVNISSLHFTVHWFLGSGDVPFSAPLPVAAAGLKPLNTGLPVKDLFFLNR